MSPALAMDSYPPGHQGSPSPNIFDGETTTRIKLDTLQPRHIFITCDLHTNIGMVMNDKID